MPFLDAKALETDPDGMAFLRSVIKPGPEREEAVLRPLPATDPLPVEALPQSRADAFTPSARPKSVEALPVA